MQILPLPTKELPESLASAVTNVTFSVASIDRLTNKVVNVQFSFITSDGGSLQSGDGIYMNYPTGFFSYSQTVRAIVYPVCSKPKQLDVTVAATYIGIGLNCDSAYSIGETVSVQLIGVTIGPTPTAGVILAARSLCPPLETRPSLTASLPDRLQAR